MTKHLLSWCLTAARSGALHGPLTLVHSHRPKGKRLRSSMEEEWGGHDGFARYTLI